MEQAAEQQIPSSMFSSLQSLYFNIKVNYFFYLVVESSTSGRDQGDGGLCSLLEELAAENTDSSSTSGASSKMLLHSRAVLLQSKGKVLTQI